jgi:hypothetical protein
LFSVGFSTFAYSAINQTLPITKKSKPVADSIRVKTPYANLIRYDPSGNYFGRVRVNGKSIRRSLETHVLSVAKLELSDFLQDHRRVAIHKGQSVKGEVIIEVFKEGIENDLNNKRSKPRTKLYKQEKHGYSSRRVARAGAAPLKRLDPDGGFRPAEHSAGHGQICFSATSIPVRCGLWYGTVARERCLQSQTVSGCHCPSARWSDVHRVRSNPAGRAASRSLPPD